LEIVVAIEINRFAPPQSEVMSSGKDRMPLVESN
jgi:hypothetical protein